MRAVVRAKTPLAADVMGFELEVSAADFITAEPGSHVIVRVGNGPGRAYSLTREALPGANRYEVAVRRCESAAGTSKQLCDDVEVGAQLELAAPRNLFRVDAGARHHVLIGGGIGITPLVAMARYFARTGSSFELHVAFSNPTHAPFLHAIAREDWGERAHVYFSRTQPPDPLVLGTLLPRVAPGSTVYACGPTRLLDEVRTLCASHGLALRVESFEAAYDAPVAEGAFEVVLQRSGIRFTAVSSRPLLDQICEAGVYPDSSCRSGTCGTCVTRVLSGELVHRDSCLYPEEQELGDQMALCVSTARAGSVLVLDI